MNKRMGAMGILVIGCLVTAAPKAVKKTDGDVLAPGAYSATIKSFVCGGCAEWVESRLKTLKTLETVKADQETRVVQFTVKKGANLKREDLQILLDGAAKDMGMGADFTLTGLKKISK